MAQIDEGGATEVCRTCGDLYHAGGDGFDDECPSCADKSAEAEEGEDEGDDEPEIAETDAGRSWWVVTCRVAFDDEDSLYILRADDEQTAMAKAERTIREENETQPEEDVFILHVVRCATEPIHVRAPQ